MQKYTAIILSSREANEFDRLYLIYTLEAGLVKAIGKGVRKSTAKLAGHLEPATLSEVYVARSKGLGQITGAITLDSFEGVKNDFEKLDEVLKISKFFVKNFAEGEKDEKIFDLFLEFLRFVNQVILKTKSWEISQDLVLEAFWWKLFDFLGQRPEVMKCVNCQKKMTEKTKKFFSVEKGRVVCGDCGLNFSGLVPINNNQIKLLRIFWGNPLAKIAKVKVEERELKGLGRIRESFERYNF